MTHPQQTFNRDLYRTIYSEATASNRGVNAVSFPRGLCGGGNANGGAFCRPGGAALPRPDSASSGRTTPRMDNLGNVSHLAPRSPRGKPFGAGGPSFRAQLTVPGRPASAYNRAPGSASPTGYARSQHSAGDFGAVSRARTPFGKWKEGQASLPRGTEPAWGDSEWRPQLGAPARGTPQNLGSYRTNSPYKFYCDPECTITAAPYNNNKVWNPLSHR